MNKFILPVVVACTLLKAVAVQAQSTYQPYVFSTLAGNHPGYANGTGSAARFHRPADLAVDSAGNVYVADSDNDTIRKITPAGVVSTFAGLANHVGSTDGTGNTARFDRPQDVAVDSANNLYVADTANHTIRKITPARVVTTIAGLAGSIGSANGTGSSARFNFPSGVALNSAGTIYVADTFNHTIRKITPARIVTTVAGLAGEVGIADGPGSDARFNTPRRVAIDNAGNIVVADTFNDTIRQITTNGNVSTLAGTPGVPGDDDGPGAFARFYRPRGVSVNSAGYIVVADGSNNRIRTISSGGDVFTLAGFYSGSADGTGTAAQFNIPFGAAWDSAGNVFVADTHNHAIRKITPAGVVSTFAGWASLGSEDGTDGAARFRLPQNLAVSSAGNIYVADSQNHTIRKITPAGAVTTLAGLAGNRGSADGTGSAARFASPSAVAVDSATNVYVADSNNSTIRKITPGGVVTTVAGLAENIGSADGSGSAARFNYPTGVAVDSANNLYVADAYNSTIRKITPAAVVSTFAGSAGTTGSADGTGSAAQFTYPRSVAVDSAGNIYVADSENYTIRKISPARVVSTLAGSAGILGSADGTGTAAQFYYPTGVAVDSARNVYVADALNTTIRKVTPGGVVTTLGGSPGVYGWADAAGSVARFDLPSGVAVASAGKLYVADTYNNSIRVGIPQLQLLSAVSRKKHNTAGTFDINLPLVNAPGVECRSSGGSHKFVFTFNNNPISGSASVTSGTGSVSGSPTFIGHRMIVDLTGVADVQKITVTLTNVTDNFAQVFPNTAVSVNMLIGDTNSSKNVNASDIAQTKSQSGVAVMGTNLREDVNLSGAINASDVALVKSRSGAGVP